MKVTTKRVAIFCYLANIFWFFSAIFIEDMPPTSCLWVLLILLSAIVYILSSSIRRRVSNRDLSDVAEYHYSDSVFLRNFMLTLVGIYTILIAAFLPGDFSDGAITIWAYTGIVLGGLTIIVSLTMTGGILKL